MRKRAPDGSPLIDFDIVAAVVPLALAGTLVGVWLNSRVAPEFIVFVLIGARQSLQPTHQPRPRSSPEALTSGGRAVGRGLMFCHFRRSPRRP